MRTILILTLALGAVITGVSGESEQIYFEKGSPHASLKQGVFKGKVDFSRDGRPYNSFIGIKYAEAKERFEEAQSIEEKWDGVKGALEPPPACAQPDSEGNITAGVEDCLYLNVFVPMLTKPKRTNDSDAFPVMVCIHGGGFTYWDSYRFGPQYFMDEDVILVTFNYRLGIFGFLSTGDEVIPGNNGLKDSTLALDWVQKNIKMFGGDSGKVTIFGESSAGASVHYLVLSPVSNGLFQKAISQSGSVLNSWAYFPNPKESAVELVGYLKCPTKADEPSEITSDEILKCVRSASVDELNDAQTSFKTRWPLGTDYNFFGPVKESQTPKSQLSPFITESPFAIFSSNKSIPDIPYIFGITEDECAAGFAGQILINESLTKEFDSRWNEVLAKALNYDDIVTPQEHLSIAEKLREFYFGNGNVSLETRDEVANIFSDSTINFGVLKSAVETVKKGGKEKVYLYQYAHHGPISMMGLEMPSPPEELNKVCHADELILHFDFGLLTGDEDPSHEVFSKHFVKLWVSFAVIGEPTYNWGDAPNKEWHPISNEEIEAGRQDWYRIEDNPGHVGDPYEKRLQFWERIHNEYFKDAMER